MVTIFTSYRKRERQTKPDNLNNQMNKKIQGFKNVLTKVLELASKNVKKPFRKNARRRFYLKA